MGQANPKTMKFKILKKVFKKRTFVTSFFAMVQLRLVFIYMAQDGLHLTGLVNLSHIPGCCRGLKSDLCGYYLSRSLQSNAEFEVSAQ